jgi:hypothetical protein
MMEAVRTSETSYGNYFTRQYIAEDNSELDVMVCRLSSITPNKDIKAWKE